MLFVVCCVCVFCAVCRVVCDWVPEGFFSLSQLVRVSLYSTAFDPPFSLLTDAVVEALSTTYIHFRPLVSVTTFFKDRRIYILMYVDISTYIYI